MGSLTLRAYSDELLRAPDEHKRNPNRKSVSSSKASKAAVSCELGTIAKEKQRKTKSDPNNVYLEALRKLSSLEFDHERIANCYKLEGCLSRRHNLAQAVSRGFAEGDEVVALGRESSSTEAKTMLKEIKVVGREILR
ncbi:unnamed protein product [Cylicocyclus nassatus]|uniref:Uncharacterized protein n=1 Tax=Cylicocyclus nassatus TaxID=53992 RepID=A0AA36DTR1_CYLNA|nr:unnamed protein product [Cylicocyclus nassatus]